MTAGARLGAYGLVLAAALAAGAALGAVAGPIDVGGGRGDEHPDEQVTTTTLHDGDHGGFGP